MSLIVGEQLKFLSANCQGLRDRTKRLDVLNYFFQLNPNIICLQDTHLTPDDENQLKVASNCNCLISGARTNARGVAILLKNNFAYKMINFVPDKDGNYIYVDIELANTTLRIVNIYAPNSDNPCFFQTINNIISENTSDHLVLCGDFNLVFDPKMDCYNYVSINNPRSRSVIMESMRTHELIDTFRYFHPNTKRYTWRRRNPVKQARLDYFIVSSCFIDLVSNCKIVPGYRSDHSVHEVNIKISNFTQGKGLWKLNCDLLKNQDFINLVNDTIQRTRLEYIAPVYNPTFLENAPDLDVTFTIDVDLVLEMILLKVREASIKFSSKLKHARADQEKSLVNQIELIEKEYPSLHSENELEKLKQQLESLREVKLKGQMVRSRAQWLHSGEKPSHYFCNLERKNFLDKTIRKICLDNGEIITNQADILNQTKEYYGNLFKSRDSTLEEVKLNEILNKDLVTKLTRKQAQMIEGPLLLNELSSSLKNMKNNKTPGIDGFPAEFFKVFLEAIKVFNFKGSKLLL